MQSCGGQANNLDLKKNLINIVEKIKKLKLLSKLLKPEAVLLLDKVVLIKILE